MVELEVDVGAVTKYVRDEGGKQSRKHLEIDITDNGVIARDLGSTNGTYVEGHQVPAATLLDGNTITIGRTRILYWASSQDQE